MLRILPQLMDMRCRDGWISRSARPAASLWFYPRTGMQPCGCVIITAVLCPPHFLHTVQSHHTESFYWAVSSSLAPASRGISQFGNRKISVKTFIYMCQSVYPIFPPPDTQLWSTQPEKKTSQVFTFVVRIQSVVPQLALAPAPLVSIESQAIGSSSLDA